MRTKERSMPGIKDRIENNVVVWLLGTLLTGFLAGIGTYEGALNIMELETINKDRLHTLEKSISIAPTQDANTYALALPTYLSDSEIELLFSKVKSLYNEQNTKGLYQLLSPIRRSQVTEQTAILQMEPVYQSLGGIISGFYVQHQFIGQQGLYKNYLLNYSVKYENAEKGVAIFSIIDDGKTYIIDSFIFNRL